jgi:hypothetical protein
MLNRIFGTFFTVFDSDDPNTLSVLNNLNTTNYRMVVIMRIVVVLFSVGMVAFLREVWNGHFEHAYDLLEMLLWIAAAFSGINTIQYGIKRGTNTGYAQAKASGSPSTVVATQGGSATVNEQPTVAAVPVEIVAAPKPAPIALGEPNIYVDDERGDLNDGDAIKPMMLAGGLNVNWGTLREKRIGIMFHYDASTSDAGAVQWLKHDSRCKVSYNTLVLDNGTVEQIAPDNRRAWHAGVCRSSDPRLVYADANSAFYGISIAATAGETATAAQKATIDRLCEEIFTKEGWSKCNDAWRVVGHNTEAWPRGRKSDPIGPNPNKPVLSTTEIRGMLVS